MTEALTCDYIRLSTGRFGNLLAPLGANLGADLLKALVTFTAGLGRAGVAAQTMPSRPLRPRSFRP